MPCRLFHFVAGRIIPPLGHLRNVDTPTATASPRLTQLLEEREVSRLAALDIELATSVTHVDMSQDLFLLGPPYLVNGHSVVVDCGSTWRVVDARNLYVFHIMVGTIGDYDGRGDSRVVVYVPLAIYLQLAESLLPRRRRWRRRRRRRLQILGGYPLLLSASGLHKGAGY